MAFPRALLRIERAIQLGAPIWNSGNQLGTYAIYRDIAAGILSDLIKDDECGPLRGVLQEGLSRAAKASTPGTAGWDLRHAFDTLVDFVAKGDAPKLYGAKRVENVAAPYYERECPKLFSYVLRAERALAEQRAPAESKAMERELAREKTCPSLLAHLRAARGRDGAQRALEQLIAGEPPEGELGTPAPILKSCTRLPALVEDLTLTVARGAPRYDDGRPDLCLSLYKKNAEEAITRYGEGGRCGGAVEILRKGLTEAKRETDERKAAWALRHAFDAIAQAYLQAIPR
jgi:hypothetical protein